MAAAGATALFSQAADFHYFANTFHVDDAAVAVNENNAQRAARCSLALVAGPEAQRKMIRNCNLLFDRAHSAELYDPAGEGLTAELTEDGIIRGRTTGIGPYYDRAKPRESLEDAVRRVQDTYFAPLGRVAGPAGAHEMDPNDRIYVFVTDKIDVPVVSYNGEIAIDYTPHSYIKGLVVITALAVRNATTRDLHVVPEADDLVRQNQYSTRRITGGNLDEPYHTQVTSYDIRNVAMAMLFGGVNPRVGLADVFAFNWPNGRETQAGRTGLIVDGTAMPRQQGAVAGAAGAAGPDISILGGPVPLRLLRTALGGGRSRFFIAPLIGRDALDGNMVVSNPGPIAADVLAGRIARTQFRNVIGIAMQTIQSRRQGDVMLHDGV